MNLRTIGRSGIQVAPLCLGGNVFDWTADEPTSFALLDQFIEAGFNFVDTANMYSTWVPGHKGGESETVIGRWMKLRGNRNRVIVATKVGMEMPGIGVGLKKGQIERAAEDSLRRLQVESIDLYYSHKDDPQTPLEETLAAFDRLVRDGKVRAMGASNISAERLEQALAISEREGLARYECVQPDYSLVARRGYEGELARVCAKHGLGTAGYYSLAAGFLTGKYRSVADTQGRARSASVSKFMNEDGLRVLEALDAVAKQVSATPTQVALAWIMAQPGVTAPIVSATSKVQLDEVLNSAEVKLDAGALERLAQASQPFA